MGAVPQCCTQSLSSLSVFAFSYPVAILLLMSLFSLCFVQMGASVKEVRVSVDWLFGRAQRVSLLTQTLNMMMVEKVIPQNQRVQRNTRFQPNENWYWRLSQAGTVCHTALYISTSRY